MGRMPIPREIMPAPAAVWHQIQETVRAPVAAPRVAHPFNSGGDLATADYIVRLIKPEGISIDPTGIAARQPRQPP